MRERAKYRFVHSSREAAMLLMVSTYAQSGTIAVPHRDLTHLSVSTEGTAS